MGRQEIVLKELKTMLEEVNKVYNNLKSQRYRLQQQEEEIRAKSKKIQKQIANIEETTEANIINEIVKKVAKFILDNDGMTNGMETQITGTIQPFNSFATYVKFRYRDNFPDTQPLIDEIKPLVEELNRSISFITSHDEHGCYMNYVVTHLGHYNLLDYMRNV